MEGEEGIVDFKVGRNIIKTIKYADDVVLMVKTEGKLQNTLDQLVTAAREYGMEINAEMKKVMMISKDEEPLRIVVNKRELENMS